MDVQRFTQLLKMTEQSLDGDATAGEALNAIRLANKMLKKNNLGWDDVTKTMIVPTPRQRAYTETAGPRGYHRGQAYEDLRRAMDEAARQTEEFARKQREKADGIKAVSIRRWFAYLRKNLEPGFTRDFIAGIHKDWLNTHKLTPEQASNLERVYKNCLKQNNHDVES